MEIFETSDIAPKMLIADDDPAIVRVLADRCTRMGFEVETATNGIQALLKAVRCKPDILLIDVHMPEADGLDVCAHLLDPDRRPLNVVVVTGSRDPETIERCEAFGAFYAHKGAGFWTELETALTEIYPQRAAAIRQLGMQSTGFELRTRPRVLLVDDDPDVKEFLVSRLEKCGVETLYAADAIQGLRMACRIDPTVIISDNFMPDGDAQYFLSRLRTTPATENIPVIVLSGRTLSDMTKDSLKREVCGHPGATHVLRKSFDTRELFAALQNFIGFERDPHAGAEAR
jgi:CheY-like chemotaxis protein